MYIASLHIPFDGTISDFSSGSEVPLTITGSSPSFVSGVFGNAWSMTDETYVENNSLTDLTSAFTIGFWLKPSYAGLVTSPGNATQSLLMPLMAKSDFTYDDNNKYLIQTSTKFVIWEETQIDGTNVMKVLINGATTATLTSSKYATGVFHYFWIRYDGTYLRLFIDLIEDVAASISGTVPASLGAYSSPFSINYEAPGYQYQIARNSGTIDDLVVFKTAMSNTDMFRASQYGAISIADSQYAAVEEVNEAIVYDDASTIQINSVFTNRGDLYVAKDNGELARGVKRLWLSRRNFDNQLEVDTLDYVTRAEQPSLQLVEGKLVIKDEIIRI